MTEGCGIGLPEPAGLKLAVGSEMNANARDATDHPEGVW